MKVELTKRQRYIYDIYLKTIVNDSLTKWNQTQVPNNLKKIAIAIDDFYKNNNI